jgi:hypothetical protein
MPGPIDFALVLLLNFLNAWPDFRTVAIYNDLSLSLKFFIGYKKQWINNIASTIPGANIQVTMLLGRDKEQYTDVVT